MGVRLYCVFLIMLAWALLAHGLDAPVDPIARVASVLAELRPKIADTLEAYTKIEKREQRL
jgi:hypothetical protein